MATFKKFKNVKSKESDSQFNDIYEAFNFIKGNRPDLDKIIQLRQLQKGTAVFGYVLYQQVEKPKKAKRNM